MRFNRKFSRFAPEGDASGAGGGAAGAGEGDAAAAAAAAAAAGGGEGDAGAGEGDKAQTPEQKAAAEAEKAFNEVRSKRAPEKYEYTLPEGVQLDQEIATEYGAFAKELGLNQGEAQKGIEFAMKLQGKWTEQLQTQFVNQQKQWIEQTKNDPDIGGAKHTEVMAIVAKTAEKVISPELMQVLEQTGLCNHPHMVKFIHLVGTKVLDDKFEIGGKGGGEKLSDGAVLFPSMKK